MIDPDIQTIVDGIDFPGVSPDSLRRTLSFLLGGLGTRAIPVPPDKEVAILPAITTSSNLEEIVSLIMTLREVLITFELAQAAAL